MPHRRANARSEVSLKVENGFENRMLQNSSHGLKPTYSFAEWTYRQPNPADLDQPTSDPSAGFRARSNPRRANIAGRSKRRSTAAARKNANRPMKLGIPAASNLFAKLPHSVLNTNTRAK